MNVRLTSRLVLAIISVGLAASTSAASAQQTCESFFGGSALSAKHDLGRIRDLETLARVTTIDQLNENHVWATHALSRLPTEGVIKARRSWYQSPTVHFALGELVPSHPNGSWENLKYAVLMPLRDLYPQVASFMALDTFTIGSVPLTSRSILVAPRGTQLEGVTVHEYDPETTSLRDAVADAIRKQGGYVFGTAKGTGAMPSVKVGFEEFINRSEPYDFMWKVEGPNVNTYEFFEPLMRRLPHRSFGLHLMSWIGDAGRMGQLMLYRTKEDAYRKRAMAPDAGLAITRAVAKLNLAKMNGIVHAMKLPPKAQAEFDSYASELSTELNSLPPVAVESVSLQFYLSPANKYDLASLHREDLDSLLVELEKIAPGFVAKSGGPALLKLAWASMRAERLVEGGGSATPLVLEQEGLRQAMKESYDQVVAQMETVEDIRARGELLMIPRILTQNHQDWVR